MDARDTRTGGHVLVVHEHDGVRKGLERLLRLSGMLVTSALDGPTALDLLREVRPDVVLLNLDTTLLDTDGFEVLRRIRAEPRTAGLPVVMYGSVADPTLRAQAIAAGANDLIESFTSAVTGLPQLLKRHMRSKE